MASIKSKRFFEPKFMPVTGAAFVYSDVVALSAAPSVGDTLDFYMPGGIEVCHVQIRPDDLDTNGAPTITFQTGYRAARADGQLVESASYFASTKTSMQNGSVLDCTFKPIVLNEDWILQLKIIAGAATFAAGEVWSLVTANCLGIR